jgi:lipopolysaccharide-induced tumor necrosis factor-alpha factor
MNSHSKSKQRANTDPFDTMPEKKPMTKYFRTSNSHSRNQSQASVKSLPLTCSSWSCHSESKYSRAESRLKEILLEIRNDSKDLSWKDFDSKGDEPFEMVTQDEVPRLVWCAFCKAETSTYLVYSTSSSTLMGSVLICVFGGMLGCCLLPYASDSCKEAKTACKKCGHLISEVNE